MPVPGPWLGRVRAGCNGRGAIAGRFAGKPQDAGSGFCEPQLPIHLPAISTARVLAPSGPIGSPLTCWQT